MIYLHRGGQNVGPYSIQQVQQLLGRGETNLAEKVWVADRQDWVVLGEYLSGQGSGLPAPAGPARPVLAATQQPRKNGWGRVGAAGLGCFGLVVLLAILGALIGPPKGSSSSASNVESAYQKSETALVGIG
ncbi:MAG TPA: GYF domain-containing protein, partial [Polyangiaceae bacterium]|nr:GYF domain-containing protein [Polyangiaceae bacterium]